MTDIKQTPTVTIPWNLAIMFFHDQLVTELVANHQMTTSQAVKYLDEHIDEHDPLIESILVPSITKNQYNRSLERVTDLVGQFNRELGELISDYPKAYGHLEAMVGLYKDAMTWDTEGRTFEGWVAMMKRYFYHEGHLAIDDYNRLNIIADNIFKENLVPFFETKCGDEARDREVLVMKTAYYTDLLNNLKEKQ